MPESDVLVITGRIVAREGSPLPGLTVRASLLMRNGEDAPIGDSARTEGAGRYRISIRDTFDDVRWRRGVRIFVSASRNGASVGDSEPHDIALPETLINLQLDVAPDEILTLPCRVHGTVRDALGALLNGTTVLAVDRDLREAQQLGSTVTHQGAYEIRYSPEQFARAEKDSADLVMQVLDADGKVRYSTPILFNVSADFEYDITLDGSTYQGTTEWDSRNAMLRPLLGNVAPQDLREDGEYEDVSFLAGETGLIPLQIAVWMSCFRLADKAAREEIPAMTPEVLFAFLAQGQPSVFHDSLAEDAKHPDRLALLDDKLLRQLAELPETMHRELLGSAVSANLVSPAVGATVQDVVAALTTVRLRYAGEQTFGGGKGTVAELIALTPAAAERQPEFLRLLTEHTGPLNTVWQQLTDAKILSKQTVRQLQQTFELGALTRNHVPLVAQLTEQIRTGKLAGPRDLAKLSQQDWIQTLKSPAPAGGGPIGAPANLDGDDDDERLRQYAAILDSQFQRSYPTASFAAKVARAATRPPEATRQLVQFLDQNPAFQLDRIRIDHYVADHPEALTGIEDADVTVTGLKTVQRIFKLDPRFSVVDALLSKNLRSAQQIYFLGRTQFLKTVADTPINAIEAKRIYAKAEATYSYALAWFGEYNAAVNGVLPAAVSGFNVDEDTEARIAALPTLQTLFGSLDYCECSSCRSVYSPAAHFVDVLRYLGERGTQGTGPNADKSVRDVLLGRRPDLGEVELSCENTNTPMPYIDLVNEVLEDVVAPPTPVVLAAAVESELTSGPLSATLRTELAAKDVALGAEAVGYAPDSRGRWVLRDAEHAYTVTKVATELRLLPSRQTFATAAEVRANPEHTNVAAYTTLRDEVFPLDLPFDLWDLQVRCYLDHLGVPYPRLLELFRRTPAPGTSSPTDLELDAARLGLTQKVRQVLTGSLPGKQPWDYWGLAENGNSIPHPDSPADPTANVTGTWIEVLSKVPILLHRTSTNYAELLQLLDMRAVNPDGEVSLSEDADPNAANCDVSTFVLQNLTVNVLSRLHRFVRLWRVLGTPMWELDIVLPDTDLGGNAVGKQITDDALAYLSQLNRLRQRTGLDLVTLHSLYAGVDHSSYADRSRDGVSVQTLYERLFRNKLVDAVASFPRSPAELNGTVADRLPGLLAALRVKEPDLNLVLADLSLTPESPLDEANLGEIFRIPALAAALHLSVEDLVRLKRLWGQDPFASPEQTLTFAELVNDVTDSAFSVRELDYLLAHRYVPSSGVALEDRTVETLIRAMRAGLQQITDDLQRKSEESPESYVKSKLGQLPTLRRDARAAVALALVDGTWEGSDPDRNALIAEFFTDVLDVPAAQTELVALPADQTPAQHQAAVDARFAFVQPGLEAFLLRTAKVAYLREQVAAALTLDVPTTAALLSGLRVTNALNDPRLLERQPDGGYTFAPNAKDFPAIFSTMRKLHSNALLIARLGLNALDVRWWMSGTRAADLGWIRAADLPADTTTSVPLNAWRAMQQFFTWRRDLPPADLTALEFAAALLDSATGSTTAVTALARVTGWEKTDIQTLAGAFGWVDIAPATTAVRDALRSSANLVRLSKCVAALRRLGVTAARALEWAIAEAAQTQAENLKQTVKSKYDLVQWQQIITPLQDTFREAKRKALVSRLVMRPDATRGQNWTDTNGLYSYFLIDVEMSACMLTSRLKQATASAQLFVQRCLLNLEPDIFANTVLDPKWKQWGWMKRYRMWEANRKVFLYPENWIEPELRDEKSPFFIALEAELKQNEITKDAAEQAYLNYLEKLEQVSNLEVRAMFEQTLSADESVLHVIGRERSSKSPRHFYRTRINRARWTAWEPVDLDIASDHLIAGVHNRRLYLLWPQYLEKAQAPGDMATPAESSTSAVPEPSRSWEIRLFWSELKKGKWTPKVLSDAFMTIWYSDVNGNNPQNLSYRIRLARGIQVRLFGISDPRQYAPISNHYFNKIGRQIVPFPQMDSWEQLVSPPESRYQYNLIQHLTASQYFYYNSVEGYSRPEFPRPSGISANANLLSAHENAPAIRVLRNVTPNQTYTVIDSSARGFSPTGSYFLWDSARGYLVDYVHQTSSSYWSGSWHSSTTSRFSFLPHYHPFVELFIKELNAWGIRGLLNRPIQIKPTSLPGAPAAFDFAAYQPESTVMAPPEESVDFDYRGTYAPYNWELFFHVPFYLANKLSANQRFEEALEWFHYIFNPMSTDTSTQDLDTPAQKFWITKPFYETTKADYYAQKIQNILSAIARGDAGLRAQVQEWRDNPFNPHLIARMRTVAYQKNVLIKYLQTIIAWGDFLFGQDAIESINEASQLYILAASILGTRPRAVPRKYPVPVKTYYQLQAEGIDGFGNVLTEIENLVPEAPTSTPSRDESPDLPRLDVLYFGIPNNDKLLSLWDTVEDRLFKIRHCMNLQGIVRQLPLFEPPIDPALLVKATAAGLDIGTVLSDLNAPLPLYRFTTMVDRAQAVCDEVKQLGAAMLSALEKRDAEGLAALRAEHETRMLDHVRNIRRQQVDEALRSKEALDESRHVTETRRAHFQKLVDEGWSDWEKAWLGLTIGAMTAETAATVLNSIGSAMALLPELDGGVSGFGGSPTVKLKYGGKNISHSLVNAAGVLKGVAGVAQMQAGMTSMIAGYERRGQEWELQVALADKELPQIDKQIAAADLRHQLAQKELDGQDLAITNAAAEAEYLATKFTNQELYDWMVGQISTVYFQSYTLAYDLARRAERAFRYELGLSDSSYIQFGYWDSLRKGLLAGERLAYDLARLRAAYLEQNRREYELTKHISVAQLDPVALLKLRQNGECFLDVPEAVFDLDYPGHYFRRIKSVSLSIPCVTGPYTTIACTLTLTGNSIRKDATLLDGAYARDRETDDPRFRDQVGAVQSIATSDGQNDDGMFQLDFRDERYLPFEGAGAISSWHLKLNHGFAPFDFATIPDVVLHLRYTAREGGGVLAQGAKQEFAARLSSISLAEGRGGLTRLFDLRGEFPDQWYRFLHPTSPGGNQEITLGDLASRLPFFTRNRARKVRRIEVIAQQADADARYVVQLSALGHDDADLLTLAPDGPYEGLHQAVKDLEGEGIDFGNWTLRVRAKDAGDFHSLPADALEELFLAITYTMA